MTALVEASEEKKADQDSKIIFFVSKKAVYRNRDPVQPAMASLAKQPGMP